MIEVKVDLIPKYLYPVERDHIHQIKWKMINFIKDKEVSQE